MDEEAAANENVITGLPIGPFNPPPPAPAPALALATLAVIIPGRR
jgi:hypothetical protein